MVSDKVVYPVREYATNAWEVSPAGKPFEVELPTTFNPQFTIRDFGPGISHKFAMKSYAKIGESTKDGDDDAVGGWGFGSKAALAYLMRSDGAGSFTVISRHRGFRRVYVIGVNATGKIEIQFMGEWVLEPEDRGTGLEITFLVREGDIDRFHEHAEAVYWSFEPKPVITPAIDFGQPKVLHQGDGWTVYRNETVPFSGPQVQLGPVMYPVNWGLAPRASRLLESNTCIVFKAKIGSISVSASREALQYDDRTEAGLRALFEHYDQDWMQKAHAAVDVEPTYFRARWKADDISRSLGQNGWLMVREIGWRGFSFYDNLFPEQGRVKACCWPDMDRVRRRDAGAHLIPLTFKADWSVNPGEVEGRVVVIQHATSRSLERFEAAGLMDTPCLWVRVKRADLDYALDRMGRPDYVVLDDIKLPPRQKGQREQRPESVKRLKVLSRNSGGNRTHTELLDTDEELVYCTLDGRGSRRTISSRYEDKARSWAASRFASYCEEMCQHGLLPDDFNLVVVDSKTEVRPHWIHVADYFAELIDAALDPMQVAPTIPWSESSFPSELIKIRDKNIDIGTAPQEMRDIYYEMLAMLQTRDGLDRAENEHDKLAALNLKITGTDVKSVAKDPTQPINDRWDALLEQAPLLELLIDKMCRSYYDTKPSKEEQRRLDHYFALLAK